jgi:hypothetical protein
MRSSKRCPGEAERNRRRDQDDVERRTRNGPRSNGQFRAAGPKKNCSVLSSERVPGPIDWRQCARLQPSQVQKTCTWTSVSHHAVGAAEGPCGGLWWPASQSQVACTIVAGPPRRRPNVDDRSPPSPPLHTPSSDAVEPPGFPTSAPTHGPPCANRSQWQTAKLLPIVSYSLRPYLAPARREVKKVRGPGRILSQAKPGRQAQALPPT